MEHCATILIVEVCDVPSMVVKFQTCARTSESLKCACDVAARTRSTTSAQCLCRSKCAVAAAKESAERQRALCERTAAKQLEAARKQLAAQKLVGISYRNTVSDRASARHGIRHACEQSCQ